jgi:small-conductance mechanosensitive channel
VGRNATTIAIVCLTAGLWALYGFSGNYRIFGGVSTTEAVFWIAWLATALLLVSLAGRLILGLGFALLDHEATGLQRGIVYAVLTFTLASIILGILGVNIAALLTTSAVLTAIVGLAMQPTLGGLIAGSSLELGRVLHVGDVILLDDQPIEVVSLNWRSIVGRKYESTTVVIPNARIAESRLDILRRDEPVRVDVPVPAPVGVSPHRISEVLSEAAYDLPYADPARPVRVEPLSYRTTEAAATYRVEYWTPHGRDLIRARQALLARVWYVYQREQIPWPVPTYIAAAPPAPSFPAVDGLKGLRLDRLADAGIRGLGSLVPAAELWPKPSAGVIADCGRPLCYADGELIVVPRGVEAFSLFLLVEGAVFEASVFATREDSPLQPSMRLATPSDRRMALERITADLAQHIGPFAEYAVREAAAAGPDPVTVCATVAREIEDPSERAGFLGRLRMDHDNLHRPGFVFGLQCGAYARVSSPPLRAVGGAVVVPIVLDAAPQSEATKRN